MGPQCPAEFDQPSKQNEPSCASDVMDCRHAGNAFAADDKIVRLPCHRLLLGLLALPCSIARSPLTTSYCGRAAAVLTWLLHRDARHIGGLSGFLLM